MRDIKNFQDENGFVGHFSTRLNQLEFGDCGQRTGTLSYITNNKELIDRYDILTWPNQKGEPVRYPKQYIKHLELMWTGEPRGMSSDNFLPRVLAKEHDKAWLRKAFIIITKRYGFMWNRIPIWPNEEEKKMNKIPDWGGPLLLIAFFRAMHYKWLKLFLYPLDISLVLMAVILLIRPNTETSDDKNFTLLMLQAKRNLPTLFSKCALWIYRKAKPEECWDNYFDDQVEDPPLNDVIRPLLRDL